MYKKMRNATNFVHEVKSLKWNWAGHVTKMQDDRLSYRITNWYIG